MIDRIRSFFAACWLAITGITLAQLNAALGCLSLLLGITYQLWRWRREAFAERNENAGGENQRIRRP
jgi:hypothetical protein